MKWEKPVVGSMLLLFILSCFVSCQRIISAQPDRAGGENAGITAIAKESLFAFMDNAIWVCTNPLGIAAALLLAGAIVLLVRRSIGESEANQPD